MFDYLGWTEAGALIDKGIESAIAGKRVTYDFARMMDGATTVSTSEFASCIIKGME